MCSLDNDFVCVFISSGVFISYDFSIVLMFIDCKLAVPVNELYITSL